MRILQALFATGRTVAPRQFRLCGELPPDQLLCERALSRAQHVTQALARRPVIGRHGQDATCWKPRICVSPGDNFNPFGMSACESRYRWL